MSAARDLLDDLAVIGATIRPAGDRLILRAGLTAIPAALVNRVSEAKAALLAALAPCADRTDLSLDREEQRDGPSHQVRGRTCEGCVVEWLNRHPAPSASGRCFWCGKFESRSAVVLPFRTEPETHTWLHAECWRAWHRARRANAVAALRAADPTLDDSLSNDHG
jgi:hypothetical protein